MDTKTIVDLNDLGSENLLSKIYDVILSAFQEDARLRFPDDYAAWAVDAMKFFDDPQTANMRYSASLWQFLFARGYAERFQPLLDKIFADIKQENDECNLVLHHMGKIEAKKLLRKEDYAKLVKTN